MNKGGGANEGGKGGSGLVRSQRQIRKALADESKTSGWKIIWSFSGGELVKPKGRVKPEGVNWASELLTEKSSMAKKGSKTTLAKKSKSQERAKTVEVY